MNKIQKIVDLELCLGCGLCETIASSAKCQMKLNENTGFYEPYFKEKLTKKETRSILKICPGINVNGNINSKSIVWGKINQIEEAWSSDSFIRQKASSGGVITTLAIHLLESDIVNGILHVGVNEGTYLFNSLRVSRTKEEVLRNMGSRYAPALVFNKLNTILDKSNEVYAFIGKPCDIAGIKNFIDEYPVYKSRITYFLAIFCAGMPSYNGTKEVLKLSGVNESPSILRYRGDGWPGSFKAEYNSRGPFKMSYNDTWGKILGKHLCLRCKICPDGIGLLADIAVGDSWVTKNGYPNFEENDGRSFVMVRTTNGLNLYSSALQMNKIENNDYNINTLKIVQRYQYDRRIYLGYRILFVQLFSSFILKFRGLGIKRLMLKGNLTKGSKNSFGTLKRYLKIKHHGFQK